MPMTSIEKFHWFDDHPAYPNYIFCRAKIVGKLDEEIAQQAWEVMISRHPLLCAKPNKKNGRWVWEWDEERSQLHFVAVESPPKFCVRDFSELKKNHLWVLISANPKSNDQFESTLFFAVHHAVVDGVGGSLVINDWLIAYANIANGKPSKTGMSPLDSSQLMQRNDLGLTRWRYLKHSLKQCVALFGAVKFVFRRTARLRPAAHQADRTIDSDYPALMAIWLADSTPVKINDRASDFNVMKNSVYLAELFLALADWRLACGVHHAKDWMRIILPVSIRSISDRRLPAANRASIVQIDRTVPQPTPHPNSAPETNSVREFYQGIDHEIDVIRRWQLDKMFLIVVRVMSMFESWIRSSARNEKSRGMAVFTNLAEPLRKSERLRNNGDPSKMPPIVEADWAGPIRQGTPLNFAVTKFGPKIRLTLHYDPAVVSDEEATEMLRIYAERLESL